MALSDIEGPRDLGSGDGEEWIRCLRHRISIEAVSSQTVEA